MGDAIRSGKTREQAIQSLVIETSKDWPPPRGKDNIGIVYDELKEEASGP